MNQLLVILCLLLSISSHLLSQTEEISSFKEKNVLDFYINQKEEMYYLNDKGNLFYFNGSNHKNISGSDVRLTHLSGNNDKVYAFNEEQFYALENESLNKIKQCESNCKYVASTADYVITACDHVLSYNMENFAEWISDFKAIGNSSQGKIYIDSLYFKNGIQQKGINAKSIIFDVFEVGEKVYFACEDGVKIYNNGKLRHFDLPQITDYGTIKKIMLAGDHLLLVSEEGKLLDFETRKYDWEEIDLGQVPKKWQMDLDGYVWMLINGKLNLYHANGEGSKSIITVKKVIDPKTKREIKSKQCLSNEENDVVFYLDIKSLSHSEKIKNQFMLDGYDQDWSEPSAEKIVSYFSLPEGKYEFKARSYVKEGEYNYAPPFYISVKGNSTPSWLYWMLGLTISLAVIGFGSTINESQKKKKIKEERDKLKMSLDVMKYKQQNLQLKLNPHFLFNALTSIQGLLSQEQGSEARKHLRSFSLMMRNVLDQSMEEKIKLEDEIKFLKNYLSLEQMIRNNQFDFEVNCNEKEYDNKIYAMMIQPFVENAIVHGVSNLKDRKGKIEVNLIRNNGKLECTVVDNGVGMDASKKDKNYKSLAISIIKERLSNLTKLKQNEVVVFQNGNDSENLASGTKVTIKLE